MASGIYTITNMFTGEQYVGSSSNIEVRWQTHRSALAQGTHINKALQAAWNEWHEPAFTFDILEEVDDPYKLLDRESVHIRILRPAYNGRPGPKIRYRVPRQDAHLSLPVDLIRRIDEASPEGRPSFIERVLREHFGMPILEEQQEG